MKFDRTKMIEALRVVQRMHYPLEVMLVCVRLYSAYLLSFRKIEEMMAERGVLVNHSTLHRGRIKMLPVLAAAFRRHNRLFASRQARSSGGASILRARRRPPRPAQEDHDRQEGLQHGRHR